MKNESILCPICGSKAKLSMVSNKDGSRKEYKANCIKSALHVSCGDWFQSKQRAWDDWAKRCTGYGQPEWFHPTNRQMLTRDIEKASKDTKAFARLVIETGERFDGWTEEKIAEYLDLRHDYGFCTGCKQFGQEFCICNKVSYQQIIDPKDSEVII